ncbi:MAG TPA: 4-(cytidine 5'-diphospho)-2-C-methyl-D-erythritol kinase [Acetobacteraceae bacterium]|nr:4-(cytidine 5'-diphospho)-2-C-methyl-D-erythritol kinase [Acetobacteraceae bacterium]
MSAAEAEAAPAKVNLFLHILGRRPDGFHLLDSLAVFPAIGDRLTATPSPALSLEITGPFAGTLAADAENLVLRAAAALAASCGIAAGARLVLEKHLPVASGIGGGSADAAAALRLLARLWQRPGALPLNPAQGGALTIPSFGGFGQSPGFLAAIAARIGADVPACLHGRPVRMGGVGEVLASAPRLPDFGMVLVNPGVALATACVFRAREGAFQSAAVLPPAWNDAASMAADLARLENGLEPAARALCPPVSDVLAALAAQPGCLMARMSGSGATCFGLFPDAVSAERAAAGLRARAPGWWAWGGEGRG